MKTEIKEIYKCEFCNKLYQIKSYAERHEKQCKKNPDNNFACYGCENLCKTNGYAYIDKNATHQGLKEVEVLKCNKLEQFMYPPRLEHKKYKLYEVEPVKMPKECDHFKEYEKYWQNLDNG